MSRGRREAVILEIVDQQDVRTQAELVEALRQRGIEASQSTVSRDVKRLGLVKVPDEEGGYRYGRPGDLRPGTPAAGRRLRRVVEEFVRGMGEGRAVLALTTPPGAADSVAIALDDAGLDEVVATVAGDDTLFVLVEDEEALASLRRRIEGWL